MGPFREQLAYFLNVILHFMMFFERFRTFYFALILPETTICSIFVYVLLQLVVVLFSWMVAPLKIWRVLRMGLARTDTDGHGRTGVAIQDRACLGY